MEVFLAVQKSVFAINILTFKSLAKIFFNIEMSPVPFRIYQEMAELDLEQLHLRVK